MRDRDLLKHIHRRATKMLWGMEHLPLRQKCSLTSNLNLS